MTRERHATLSQQAWLWLTALIAIGIDQLTKWRIESTLAVGESIYPLPGLSHIFRLVHVLNRGVAFGSLEGWGWLSVVVAFGVTAYLLYMNFVTPGKHLPFRITLGLILGGALGNVIDRFRLGHVTDFIHFNFRPLIDLRIFDIAVFNWADIFIFTGVFILAFLMITNRLPDELDQAERAAPAPPRPAATAAAASLALYQPVIRLPEEKEADPGRWEIARFGVRALGALGLGIGLWLLGLVINRRLVHRRSRRTRDD